MKLGASLLPASFTPLGAAWAPPGHTDMRDGQGESLAGLSPGGISGCSRTGRIAWAPLSGLCLCLCQNPTCNSPGVERGTWLVPAGTQSVS